MERAMKVEDAMAHSISTATPEDSLRRVAELMKKEDAGFIPICEGDSLVGVVTDRDIVIRGLAEGATDLANQPAKRYMSTDVVTVEASAELDEAARLMEQHEIRRLPVTEGGKVVGVLSHGNLVQAFKSEGSADRATLGVTKGA
jgi:CBS domain-containing protein